MNEILSSPGAEAGGTIHSFQKRIIDPYDSPTTPTGKPDKLFFRRPNTTLIILENASEVNDFARFPIAPNEESQLDYPRKKFIDQPIDVNGPEGILTRLVQFLKQKGHTER